VGNAELRVSADPSLVLGTLCLGSGVGIAAYDPVARAGGLLHFLLPDSRLAPEKAAARPALFADTGLDLLFRSLAPLGVQRDRIRLFVAGGADVIGRGPGNFKFGERNLGAATAYLARHACNVRQSEVRGTIRRMLRLEIATGLVSLGGNQESAVHSLAA
jgi:chemotaxis protein CheD